jgi:hypothetical protein
VHGEVVERHFEFDLVVEQHQLPRNPRLLGSSTSAPRAASAVDLAGTGTAAAPGRHIRRSIARVIDADAARRARCR